MRPVGHLGDGRSGSEVTHGGPGCKALGGPSPAVQSHSPHGTDEAQGSSGAISELEPAGRWRSSVFPTTLLLPRTRSATVTFPPAHRETGPQMGELGPSSAAGCFLGCA